MARDAGTLGCEFRELSHRESYMGNLPKLAAYSYRRAGARQWNFVLVNDAMHADARAAVEAALGPVADLRPAEKAPRRRPRRQPAPSDGLSPAMLAFLGLTADLPPT
jgi:hypothetical protein